MRSVSASLATAFALPAAGCALIAGVQDGHLPGEGGGGSSSSTFVTSGTGAHGTCHAGDVCVQAAEGWSGPVAIIVAHGKDPDDCTGAFANEITLLNGGLQADPAECACQCDAAQIACSSPPTLDIFSSASCAATACSSADVPPDPCWDLSPSCTLASATMTAAPTGSCTPSVSTVKPPVVWAKTIRVCAPTDEPGACPGGACVPPVGAPFDSFVCVTAAGDLACPDGFPTKTLGYTGFTDSRGCTGACECLGPSCGVVTYWSDPGCAGFGFIFPVPHTCVDFGGSFLSIQYAATPSCPPNGTPTPTGNVNAKQPQTICCI